MFVAAAPLFCTLLVTPAKLAGDVGFDPLKLSAVKPPLVGAPKTSAIGQYRESELKHGRIAMLASVAFPAQEKFHAEVATALGLPNLLEATDGLSPSLINGGLDQAPLPVFLAVVGVLASLMEVKASGMQPRDPGDFGLTRPINFNTMSILKSGEIWNARLAMLAVLSYVVWEGATNTAVSTLIG